MPIKEVAHEHCLRDYWGPKPPVKEARIFFIPEDTTRTAKLLAQEVDLIQGLPYPSVKDVQKRPDFKLVKPATNQPTQAEGSPTKVPHRHFVFNRRKARHLRRQYE